MKKESKDKTKTESPPSLFNREDEENQGKHRKQANECNAMQNDMTRAKDEGKMVTAG